MPELIYNPAFIVASIFIAVMAFAVLLLGLTVLQDLHRHTNSRRHACESGSHPFYRCEYRDGERVYSCYCRYRDETIRLKVEAPSKKPVPTSAAGPASGSTENAP